MLIPRLSPVRDPTKRIDLTTALQYGTAQGYPCLVSFVRQFALRHLHGGGSGIPYAGGADVILTCGSTDGFSKVLELLIDPFIPGVTTPSQREHILVEKFMYGNVLSQVSAKGVIPVPVEMDAMGMLASGPGGLEDVLANWDSSRESRGKRPKWMYTVTIGQNPTSAVLPVERRREIYALCEKYDVIIVEDDPYWYLQYPSAEAEEAKTCARSGNDDDHDSSFGDSHDLDLAEFRGNSLKPTAQTNNPTRDPNEGPLAAQDPFLTSLVPSYLTLDTSGRVIRLDTFSKTMAPGCRLGWITAQPPIVDRLLRITESTTQQPSGFVQSMVSSLLLGLQPDSAIAAFNSTPEAEKPTFEGWDISGFVRWLAGLRGAYERRMLRMSHILSRPSSCMLLKESTPLAIADRDYGLISTSRLIAFNFPRGGMFLWLRVYFESHPLFDAPRPLMAHPYPPQTLHHYRNGAAFSVPQQQQPSMNVQRRRLIDGAALSIAFMMYCTHKPHLVLVSPGVMFAPTEEIRRDEGWKYYRMCFAAESEENVDACSYRFVVALHKFWKIKKVDVIEKLLEEFEGPESFQRSAGGNAELVGNLGWIGC